MSKYHESPMAKHIRIYKVHKFDLIDISVLLNTETETFRPRIIMVDKFDDSYYLVFCEERGYNPNKRFWPLIDKNDDFNDHYPSPK